MYGKGGEKRKRVSFLQSNIPLERGLTGNFSDYKTTCWSALKPSVGTGLAGQPGSHTAREQASSCCCSLKKVSSPLLLEEKVRPLQLQGMNINNHPETKIFSYEVF